ncbi:MAG: hypothetical protein V4539_19735 [Bacteroidota bacterium]
MKLFASYVPGTDGNLAVWASTYKEKLGQLGESLGLSTDEIEEQQAAAQSIIDSVNKADLKKAEMKEATLAKDLTKQNSLQVIRAMVARIKMFPSYSANAGKELGIVIAAQTVDNNYLKPVITPTAFHGYVSVSFNKQRAFGVRVFSRLKGQQEWQPLGVARISPYVDDRPLAEAGRPETREYRARCYDGLDEMGYLSDIATVVYGG